MHKPIVVLDTNIYISATFWTGKPYYIVQKAIEQDIVAFVSDDIIQEIRRVSARDLNQEPPVTAPFSRYRLVERGDLSRVVCVIAG